MPYMVLRIPVAIDPSWDVDAVANDLVWPIAGVIEKELGVEPGEITHEIQGGGE